MCYYERIDGSKYRNIWVAGDLHGCYTNLMNKLDTIGFDNKKDLLTPDDGGSCHLWLGRGGPPAVNRRR